MLFIVAMRFKPQKRKGKHENGREDQESGEEDEEEQESGEEDEDPERFLWNNTEDFRNSLWDAELLFKYGKTFVRTLVSDLASLYGLGADLFSRSYTRRGERERTSLREHLSGGSSSLAWLSSAMSSILTRNVRSATQF